MAPWFGKLTRIPEDQGLGAEGESRHLFQRRGAHPLRPSRGAPIVQAAGARHGMSLISAVTARGHMRFMIIEKSSVNTGVFIEFLKRLIEGAGRKIFLIVDRGQAHRAKKAGAFVQTLGGILRLFFLPPYSPDRNPDEAARDFVWNRAGTGRDRRAGRQTELVAMGLPPQGQRPSWRACRTTPPPVPRAAKAWVRLSLAISALISGSPAAGRHGGQFGWAHKENQICRAHFIRDVQYAIGAGDRIFAPAPRHLPGRACRIGRRRERLMEAALKVHARGSTLASANSSRTRAGGSGRHQAPAHRQEDPAASVRLRQQPRHSGGEQCPGPSPRGALRPCVVFEKITNGFRPGWGARLYAGIRSVIETARRRATGVHEAIRLTLAGMPLPNLA
jgi:hypothetical protein